MDDGNDLVVRTIREHATALLRTARRHSLCADDAHDAYQRALEIFLRRAATLEPDTAVRWLHVVVKHEAQAVRRARQQLVASEEIDLDARAADALPDADERVLRFDRLARSAEALERLKPQEVRALWLKAQGHSYQEIADTTGWTYTKVNRCITEGRRAFLRRYAGIEAGEECRRWAPVVSALVDGEATAEQLAAARPHLRRCAGCRATVRELRVAGPRLAGALPVVGLAGAGAAGLIAPAGAAGGPGRLESLARAAESAWLALQGRAGGWAFKLQHAGEAATATKVAAVAASAAAIAGGGAMAAREVGPHPRRAVPSAGARASRVPAVTPAAVLARAALQRTAGVGVKASARAAATVAAGSAGAGREFVAAAFEFPASGAGGEFVRGRAVSARAAVARRGARAAAAPGAVRGPGGEFRDAASGAGGATAGAAGDAQTRASAAGILSGAGAVGESSGASWEGAVHPAQPSAAAPPAARPQPASATEFAGEFDSG